MGAQMKTVALVQARMGSMRLPNKVMKPVGGVPMIGLLLSRLAKAQEIDQIVVATSVDIKNKVLTEYVQSLGYLCLMGSENDVLDRYAKIAADCEADIVIRITGDCPLIDPGLVDNLVKHFKRANLDYLCNNYPPTYPDGLDTEVFSIQALQQANVDAVSNFDREHVTPYMRNSGQFKIATSSHSIDLSDLRWTVDEMDDFNVIEKVFDHFSPRIDFSWKEVLELQKLRPDMFKTNQNIERNAGATMGSGEKLWLRAKKVIPGGNMLLSKRAEMFLPDAWPAYYSRAKGCSVWDLDGVEYKDVGLMGVGTNTLGYGHIEVDAAVRKTIDAGNMTSLNCPEEVYLAERLVELHPWADMVRFARTGGEANAIAIRIARAASGREKVAFCGYHGWHDWYLAANLGGDENLSGHLLSGLAPKGVPQSLRDSVLPFEYNQFEQLLQLTENYDIGTIVMEVSRNHEPKNRFLERVRELATQKNIVLVFDECTSGFRQTFGGLHLQYGIEPDIAIFGKALGNGYAITSIIGRRDVMEVAQSTFISSTFWTERIGPSAALKTLEVMERIRSWELITQIGKTVTAGWKSLAETHGLTIETSGLSALTGFSFKHADGLAYKTLITQEMLARGHLATTSFYACTEHTPAIIATYLDNLDPVFKLIKDCEQGKDINQLLKGPVCHSGFTRLN